MAEEHELTIRQLSEWGGPLNGRYPNKLVVRLWPKAARSHAFRCVVDPCSGAMISGGRFG